MAAYVTGNTTNLNTEELHHSAGRHLVAGVRGRGDKNWQDGRNANQGRRRDQLPQKSKSDDGCAECRALGTRQRLGRPLGRTKHVSVLEHGSDPENEMCARR